MVFPSISIVMANRNHGRFLRASLAALVAQLSPDDEIIAFDDASTDDSVCIYQEFASRTPQIKLILKQQNQGAIACANEGLARAERDYIYFAASDDRIRVGFLNTARKLLSNHPKAGLFSCRTRIIDAASNDLGILPTPQVLTRPDYLAPEKVAHALLRDDNWLVGVATVYRRAALDEINGFRPELSSFTDGFASRVIALRHGTCYSPEALVEWRRLEEGYSSQESTNMGKVMQVSEIAIQLMTTKYVELFPPAYPKKWRARWLFGARYYSFCRRQGARWRTDRHIKGVAGVLLRASMSLERFGVGLWMFLNSRPGDLSAVAKRRLLSLFERSA